MAAFAPGSLKRTASLADGWMPVGATVDQLKSITSQLRSMAQAAGKDPKSLKVIARYNLAITERAQGKDRPFFSGTIDQIKDDVLAVKAFGPDELIIDPTFSPDSQTEQGFLRNMEGIGKMA